MDVDAFNYKEVANTDDNSCIPVVEGCTDVSKFNYDANANTDDNSCYPIINGCRDSTMKNYNGEANTDADCVPFKYGCMDSTMFNYDAGANTEGECNPHKKGCMDEEANNFDSAANQPVHGMCKYVCDDSVLEEKSVVFCAGCDYTGEKFTLDQKDINELNFSPRSMRIPDGRKVTLHEKKDLKGDAITFKSVNSIYSPTCFRNKSQTIRFLVMAAHGFS